MKKTLKLLNALLVGGLILANVACSEDDPEESCNKPNSDVGTCSADDLTICCNDNEVCYYIYKGTEYQESELDKLATACAASSAQIKSISLQLDEETQKVLNEARLCAVCN